MGFMSLKATCGVCGKECGLNRFKIKKSDSWCCADCMSKIGGMTATISGKSAVQCTIEEIKEAVEQRYNDIPEGAIYNLETPLGSLIVYEDYCMTKVKKRATNLLIGNKYFSGEKKFYYTDLTSVQFREPGSITDGYIEFEFPGSRSGNNVSAYNSENAFTFAQIHLAQMKEIYEFIDRKIRESKGKTVNSTSVISPADEIMKFKTLLDSGIITQEEFDAKKKQILGL